MLFIIKDTSLIQCNYLKILKKLKLMSKNKYLLNIKDKNIQILTDKEKI